MTREEAKEEIELCKKLHLYKYSNGNKIYDYSQLLLFKLINKIYDDFEEREKFLATEDILCNGCTYYLSDNGNFPLHPCIECSRFYADSFERKNNDDSKMR